MVHSVGQKLKQARLAKNVTVEQAAHATKIRVERVRDLENDDFTNFPNLTYAKGFLIIYAKYLGVDVSDFTGTLVGARNVGVEDYEYLQKASPRPGVSARPESKTSPWPVLFGLVLVFIAIIGIFIVPKLFQLGDLDTLNKPTPTSTIAPEPTATPVSTPIAVAPISTPTPTPIPSATPEVPVARAIPVNSITPTPTPLPSSTPEPDVEIRRAEPVNPTPGMVPVVPPQF